jgi:hypothetical protein
MLPRAGRQQLSSSSMVAYSRAGAQSARQSAGPAAPSCPSPRRARQTSRHSESNPAAAEESSISPQPRAAGSNCPRPGRCRPAELTARPGMLAPAGRPAGRPQEQGVRLFNSRSITPRTLPPFRSAAGQRQVSEVSPLTPLCGACLRAICILAGLPRLALAGFAAVGPTSTCAIH